MSRTPKTPKGSDSNPKLLDEKVPSFNAQSSAAAPEQQPQKSGIEAEQPSLKKRRLTSHSIEGSSYLQDLRRQHSTPTRKLNKKVSRASLPEATPEQKVLHMIAHEQPLEVDYKKINRIENDMKEHAARLLRSPESELVLSETLSYFRQFEPSALNNEQLTKTKVPNIVKFLAVHLRELHRKEFDPLVRKLQELHKTIEQSVLGWLCNTDYYDSFLTLNEVQQKPAKQHSDFTEKLLSLFKKNYYLKKEYSKKIADRLQHQLRNEPSKRKKAILRQLKVQMWTIQKKSIDLKYNRKEKLTEEDINTLADRILNEA